MITLTPEECSILIKKLEYNFKKKANLKFAKPDATLTEPEALFKKLLDGSK